MTVDLFLNTFKSSSGWADHTWSEPEDVLLAVEVVAADTRGRDREVKPRKCAAAGVPNFWRVEQDGDERLPVGCVYVCELDPATRAYGLTGIFRDRLKATAPSRSRSTST